MMCLGADAVTALLPHLKDDKKLAQFVADGHLRTGCSLPFGSLSRLLNRYAAFTSKMPMTC